MLTQSLVYVLEILVDGFVLAVLTRFYAQALRASFRNPLAQFIVALTDWAIKPLLQETAALQPQNCRPPQWPHRAPPATSQPPR